ncbi:TPA: hypothetical protein ENS27_05555 [bacterium]|nr:hypothetical protein [bacterium]
MKNDIEYDIKYKWIDHPLKANWKVSIILIIFLIVLCSSIYISFDSITFLILSIIFLFCSLSSFFLPTTYIIDEEQIIVKFMFRNQTRKWDSFKRCYPDKNGVFLSPFSHKTRLENFRGLYIRLGKNSEEVLDFIKQKIDKSQMEGTNQ